MCRLVLTSATIMLFFQQRLFLLFHFYAQHFRKGLLTEICFNWQYENLQAFVGFRFHCGEAKMMMLTSPLWICYLKSHWELKKYYPCLLERQNQNFCRNLQGNVGALAKRGAIPHSGENNSGPVITTKSSEQISIRSSLRGLSANSFRHIVPTFNDNFFNTFDSLGGRDFVAKTCLCKIQCIIMCGPSAFTCAPKLEFLPSMTGASSEQTAGKKTVQKIIVFEEFSHRIPQIGWMSCCMKVTK